MHFDEFGKQDWPSSYSMPKVLASSAAVLTSLSLELRALDYTYYLILQFAAVVNFSAVGMQRDQNTKSEIRYVFQEKSCATESNVAKLFEKIKKW